MDPRWQSTTHVQTPPPVPLSDVPEHLRTRLVEAVLDQVSAGHWTVLDAADGLRALGFAASPEKVKAAITARDRAFEHQCDWTVKSGCAYIAERAWLLSRLARPVDGLNGGAA